MLIDALSCQHFHLKQARHPTPSLHHCLSERRSFGWFRYLDHVSVMMYPSREGFTDI